MKTKTFIFNRKALIALAVSAAFPITSMAAAGRVEFAMGGATAISKEGTARSLTKGADINSGDTIKTTDGRVQVRFTDGGYMSLQPNTEFVVENYSYDGKQDGSERGFFRLVEGGLRAITGVVGRNNRPAYRVATPVATIGIRGSEFLTEYREAVKRLRTRVIGGSILVENQYGNLILFKGQGSETEEGKKPGYSDDESGVQAKGPDGAKPDQVTEESQKEKELATAFIFNEQYGEEGVSIALQDVTPVGIESVIQQYNAQNMVGFYAMDTGDSSVSGLRNGKVHNGFLDIYFGSYEVVNGFSISAQHVSGSGSFGIDYAGFYLLGTINPDGTINLAGEGEGGQGEFGAPFSTALCTSFCTVTGSGLLSGNLGEQANINYSISGINPAYSATGGTKATVSAEYDAYAIADEATASGLFLDPSIPTNDMILAEYFAQNAEAGYILTGGTVSGLPGGQFEYGYLDIKFGSGQVNNEFSISTVSDQAYFNTSFFAGSINSSGQITFSGTGSDFSGGICSGGCDFTATGGLTGLVGNFANINYSISGNTNFTANGKYEAEIIVPVGADGAEGVPYLNTQLGPS